MAVLNETLCLCRRYSRPWIFFADPLSAQPPKICLVGYCSFITVAAHYGFGQSNKVLDPRDVSKAILFEAIGQTFAVVGMAVAKWSLGLFLLRLLRVPWHKTAVWVMMVLLMFASISTCFVFWLQCTPPAYLWDRTIEGGACEVDSTPVSMLLCGKYVLAPLLASG